MNGSSEKDSEGRLVNVSRLLNKNSSVVGPLPPADDAPSPPCARFDRDISLCLLRGPAPIRVTLETGGCDTFEREALGVLSDKRESREADIRRRGAAEVCTLLPDLECNWSLEAEVRSLEFCVSRSV